MNYREELRGVRERGKLAALMASSKVTQFQFADSVCIAGCGFRGELERAAWLPRMHVSLRRSYAGADCGEERKITLTLKRKDLLVKRSIVYCCGVE